jgi:hypothetical protein
VEESQEGKVHQEGHLKEAEKNPGSVESEWIEPNWKGRQTTRGKRHLKR